MFIYLWLSHTYIFISVQQKLAQHCKSTIIFKKKIQGDIICKMLGARGAQVPCWPVYRYPHAKSCDY